MRHTLALLLGGLLLAAPAYARVSPEQALEKAIEGRVAGEPVSCINLRRIRSSQIIDRTAIVYDMGSVVYVNRPRSGARSLDHWDVLVTRPFSSQLCSIDVVELYDPSVGMQTGLVFLGDFVPYRKVKTASAE